MSERFLIVALLLAYGPFVLMAFIYAVALLLRIAGKPWLLTTLIERTKTPQAIRRLEVDGIIHTEAHPTPITPSPWS